MLVFGVLLGVATALLFTPSIAAVGHYFKARRGFATGIASTGGGVGGVVFPVMLQRLFETVGWAWAIRILALVCLAVSLAANLLIRSRLPPARNASAHPDIKIFKNLSFFLTTVGIFLLEFGLFIPLTYISLYALAHGFSPALASQLVTVLNAASVLGRLLPGWYADRIGVFNANMIAAVLSVVSCLAVWLPAGPTEPGLVVFAFLFGFASGSNISLTPVCIGRLCATAHYGRYYATCYTVVSLATLVGIPIAGNILAANDGEYWGLILFTGVIYAGSLAALFAAKVSSVGWHVFAVF